MNRFADYFFICGLDLNSGMEPDRVAGDNLRISPIERSYKGKVLAHYPDKVARNPFDASAICMLSMPGGLKFRTQKHAVAQAPAFHSFVVTREDAQRYYGFSLVFYEEVKNRDICTAMQTLQAMYITELSSEIHIRPQSQESRSLPRHFRLSTQGPNGYSTSAAHYDITRDRLLVSKCIGIVCQRAYVHASRLFLENLYRCATCKNKLTHGGQNGARSLESYVFNLLYEVEVPAAGKSLLIQLPPPDPRLPPARAVIQNPTIPLELPHFDFPLRPLFQWLGLEAALRLFTCLLLEHQVLLRSSDAQRLMIVAEGITTLLFPFTWPHVYVPILPAALHHFLDAPVPYLMGLHTAVDNVNTGAGALCYVDIDKCRIQVPEEVPDFPHVDSFLLELRACLDRHSVRLPGPDAVSHSPGAPRGLSSTLPCKPRQRLAVVDVMESERPPSPPGSARSEALQRIADIVRRTGVALDAAGEGGGTDTPTDGYIEDVKLNTAVREIFLNRFLHTFQHYENFVIYPPECPGLEENRECFDKASFLSDQPEQHRPFLWRFLESQMFATFIDGKVAGGTSPELRIFDARLRSLLQHHGGARPLTYEPCAHSHDLQRLAEHRLASPDYESPPPREILASATTHSNRQFPLLSREALNGTPVTSQGSIPRAGGKAGLPPLPCGAKRGERKTGEVSSPALIAQANWTFVETLLKDCKAKTKRMVLAKLGSEEDPGGGPATCSTTSSGIEESTLVASLCDFLERVWAHGLQRRRGKSALWSHLATYQERAVAGGDTGHRRELLHDIEAVQAMKEVRTCIGKARAWIRLALEKKQLSRHVRELLAGDPDLLRHHYRRSAFLRCEEEREQFLYHLLSLNAVDYYCFTNTYATASMPYRITIVPTRKGSTCSSNVWVVLSGTLSETRRISIPRGSLTFDHKNQNIGVLTTLRIGHDNAGMNARWMVDYVLVKNMITGHLFKFPCGRWLGRGVDDGSSERLLIGSLLPTQTSENEEPSGLGGSGHTTPRSHSPGPPPRTPDLKPSQIQHLLGDCVNSIVKWQYRRAADRTGALTVLLCGDQGLAACLEKVFLYGFKSGRLFTGRLYLWDYLCRVREQFEGDLQEDSGGGSIGRSASLERSQRETSATRRACCRLLREISSSSSSLGKDGKFQLFVCLAFREHLLRRMLGPLVSTRATQELYEEHSFLRQRSLLTFLTQILLPLDDIDVVLEKSVTYGISSTSLP